MVIAVDFSMFDTTNAKLSRSADSLESALAHCKYLVIVAQFTLMNQTI